MSKIEREIKDLEKKLENIRIGSLGTASLVGQLLFYFEESGLIPIEVLRQIVSNAIEHAKSGDLPDKFLNPARDEGLN
jgi:hypothetical protein